jgi:hypothetical protein
MDTGSKADALLAQKESKTMGTGSKAHTFSAKGSKTMDTGSKAGALLAQRVQNYGYR